ncbi:hypothetical protein Dsin_031451 [Dipteronia sinensis]|uniref:PGG domain-containing protein n=1 Tax=Dipteronia sinensis TaxID=43782 RepID=A0AAD9ZLI5_9ROSI|nr:hypothetical protein Dsin_031451 [Dipteronia sinensis]
MEPAHFEAAFNGDLNKFPFCVIEGGYEPENLSEIFNKLTPSGNSLLHVASSSGHEEMTQLIAHKFPFLITKQNYEGNTALHLAVRARKFNTVKILVNLSKQSPNTTSTDTLLTLKNKAEENTALHEALLTLHASKKNVNISVDVACYLVSIDPNVSCLQNKARKSPLCMAVESGNKEIVEYILKALPYQGNGLLQRLQGKSPVHVAIEQGKLDMLKVIKERKAELILLSRDEEGNTPLHFAAYMGCIEEVLYLLEIKSDWAFERNSKGFYPLHLACENGHIKVIKELLRKWPDPTELLCNEGQNILHVAAKSGKDNVVRCLLNEKGTDKLVNKIDINGNTPYHLAAIHGNSMILVTLMRDKRSKIDLVNYRGLTAYDILESNIYKEHDHQIDVNERNLKASGNVEENSAEVDLKSYKKTKQFQMMMTYSMLYMYHDILQWMFRNFQRWCENFLRYCENVGIRSSRPHHHITKKISRIKRKPPTPKQDLNNTINILFVVAALVVGAAFAGVLQVPIGDDKKDSYNHKASPPTSSSAFGDMDNDVRLSFFLYYNIITMSLSIAAAFTLFLALVLDKNLATILVSIAFLLLELAVSFMGFAFFWAMWIRARNLKHDLASPSILNILTIFQYIQMVVVTIPFLNLTLGRKGLALIIYFLLFLIYYPLYRVWNLICFNPLKSFVKFVICCSVYVIPFYVVMYSSFFIFLVNQVDEVF